MLNNLAGQGLSLLVFLVTARFVSKEAFGIMAVSLLTVEAFRQVVIGSFGVALTAQRDPSPKDYNACFLIVLVTSVAAAAFLFALAGPVASLLGHDEIRDTLRLVCLILLTAGLSQTHEVWLAKHMQFRVLALRSLLSILIGGGIGIAMAVNGYGLDALITQQIVTAVTAVAFLWGAASWKPGLATDRSNVMALLHYTKHLFLSRATSFAGSQSDIFFASLYLGPAATGAYNAAKRILLAMSSTLYSALSAVVLPTFASFGQGTPRLSSGFLKAASFTSLLTAPLYCGLFVLSDDTIRILIGEKWLDAAPIVSALVLSSYLNSMGQYNHSIFLVSGKPQWEAWLNIAYASANIALYVLVARYGAVMIALAFSLRALVLYPLSLLPAARLLGLPPMMYIRGIAPSVLAGIGMAGCIWLLKVYALGDLSPLLRVLILVPVGVVIYGLLASLLNRRQVAEVLAMARHVVGR